MFGFGQLIDILKKNPKKIVFTEGNDPRILEASSRLLASNFLHRSSNCDTDLFIVDPLPEHFS